MRGRQGYRFEIPKQQQRTPDVSPWAFRFKIGALLFSRLLTAYKKN